MEKAPRFEKKPKVIGNIVIQKRDLEIVNLIWRYRFMSSEQIQFLIEGSNQVILRRLQKLYHHGYLDRPISQIVFSNPLLGPKKMVYGLGDKGADLLAETDGMDRGKTNDSDYYVIRLLDLKETLQKYLKELQPSILVEIVHLEIVDNKFGLYTGEPKHDGNKWSFIRTNQQALSGDLLFQLFIVLGVNQQDFVWVLLPLGSFSDNKYPQGYKTLLGKVPSENIQIVSVSRPAKLQKVIYDNSNLYVVKQTMQFKYE